MFSILQIGPLMRASRVDTIRGPLYSDNRHICLPACLWLPGKILLQTTRSTRYLVYCTLLTAVRIFDVLNF